MVFEIILEEGHCPGEVSFFFLTSLDFRVRNVLTCLVYPNLEYYVVKGPVNRRLSLFSAVHKQEIVSERMVYSQNRRGWRTAKFQKIVILVETF